MQMCLRVMCERGHLNLVENLRLTGSYPPTSLTFEVIFGQKRWILYAGNYGYPQSPRDSVSADALQNESVIVHWAVRKSKGAGQLHSLYNIAVVVFNATALPPFCQKTCGFQRNIGLSALPKPEFLNTSAAQIDYSRYLYSLCYATSCVSG